MSPLAVACLVVYAIVALLGVLNIWENGTGPSERQYALMGCAVVWPVTVILFALFCVFTAWNYFIRSLMDGPDR